jgi:hypothetical protein
MWRDLLGDTTVDVSAVRQVLEEVLMGIVGALDLHRKQVTFDCRVSPTWHRPYGRHLASDDRPRGRAGKPGKEASWHVGTTAEGEHGAGERGGVA